MFDKLTSEILGKVAGFHDVPQGAFALRQNGKSKIVNSSDNILIEKKKDGSGLNILIKSSCNGEICHIPVVITDSGVFEKVYNDFIVEAGAKVTIVAGCGLHVDENSEHLSKHKFVIGKNAEVKYIENHIALGKGKKKVLSPEVEIALKDDAEMIIETNQLGGVDYADRKTKIKLYNNSKLEVYEKILTSRFEVSKTNFVVDLFGENSKCNIVSRSVAKQESEQTFKSKMCGRNKCFGRVECDGILMDNANINSTPAILAKNKNAMLSHEASIGKIAQEQILKLMTFGKTEKEAEEIIIESFLK